MNTTDIVDLLELVTVIWACWVSTVDPLLSLTKLPGHGGITITEEQRVGLIQKLNVELLEPQQQLLGCKDKNAKKRIKKAAKELDAAIANLRGDQGSTVQGGGLKNTWN